MPDRLPTEHAGFNRPISAPTAGCFKDERAARQFCVFAARTSYPHALRRGDTMDWKKVRLEEEGVDNLGFKRKKAEVSRENRWKS